jgi:hypothetical protein
VGAAVTLLGFSLLPAAPARWEKGREAEHTGRVGGRWWVGPGLGLVDLVGLAVEPEPGAPRGRGSLGRSIRPIRSLLPPARKEGEIRIRLVQELDR